MNKKRNFFMFFVIMIVLFGCWTVPIFSQNAFYEALPLSKINENNITQLAGLLKKDTLTASEKQDLQKLIAFLQNPWDYVKKNDSLPFSILKTVEDKLTKEIAALVEKGMAADAAALKQALPPTSTYGPVANQGPGTTQPQKQFVNKTFQANLIDAVGIVITDRFKEDVTTIYINKLKAALQANEIFQQIEILMPRTSTIVMKDDPFTFLELGNQWKTAFQGDLNQLPENLLKDVETNYPKAASNKLFPYVEMVVLTGGKLLEGYHLVDILGLLDIQFKLDAQSKGPLQDEYKRIYEAIHFLQIFQSNLQYLDDNGTFSSWISLDQLEELVDSPAGISYFLAILYLQDKNYFDSTALHLEGKSISLEKLMADSSTFFRDHIFPIYQELVALGILDKTDKPVPQHFSAYIGHTINILKNIFTIFKPKPNPHAGIESEIAGIIDNGAAIYKSIAVNKHDKVLENGLNILGKLSVKKKKLFVTLTQFAGFIEGIASAKTASEMRAVISAVIMPTGSFMAKRSSRFSLTVSSHPGLFIGAEKAVKHTSGESDWGTSWGFTAPLGLEFCWGSKTPKFISSLGVFASIADLGAVVSYRLPQSDQYSGLPADINLKQIFSPGLSLNFGFKNSPLAMGLGVQYTPELRKITDENGAVIKANAWRGFLRLSWDLPLVNVHITSFKKKTKL